MLSSNSVTAALLTPTPFIALSSWRLLPLMAPLVLCRYTVLMFSEDRRRRRRRCRGARSRRRRRAFGSYSVTMVLLTPTPFIALSSWRLLPLTAALAWCTSIERASTLSMSCLYPAMVSGLPLALPCTCAQQTLIVF